MPLVMRLLLPILLFPIEVFSHLARIMSLTIRLFCQYVCRRNGHAGFLFAFAPGDSSVVRRIARRSFVHSDLYFRVAGMRVSGRSDGQEH